MLELNENDGGGYVLKDNALTDLHILAKQREKKIPNYLSLAEQAQEDAERKQQASCWHTTMF